MAKDLDLAGQLEAARERSRSRLIGQIEAHCDHQACNVRGVGLTFKEHNGATPPRLVCPSCRQPLRVHHVKTLEEALASLERGE